VCVFAFAVMCEAALAARAADPACVAADDSSLAADAACIAGDRMISAHALGQPPASKGMQTRSNNKNNNLQQLAANHTHDIRACQAGPSNIPANAISKQPTAC